MSVYLPVFSALAKANARYVIVGGLAVVMHGHSRLTADVDIVVDLDPDEARRAVQALVDLGLKPRAPVNPLDFAEPQIRRQWIEEKGLQVFSFWDPVHPLRAVDIFTEHPIPFDDLWKRAVDVDLGGVHVRIASKADLILLKEKSGRDVDLEDIRALRNLQD